MSGGWAIVRARKVSACVRARRLVDGWEGLNYTKIAKKKCQSAFFFLIWATNIKICVENSFPYKAFRFDVMP